MEPDSEPESSDEEKDVKSAPVRKTQHQQQQSGVANVQQAQVLSVKTPSGQVIEVKNQPFPKFNSCIGTLFSRFVFCCEILYMPLLMVCYFFSRSDPQWRHRRRGESTCGCGGGCHHGGRRIHHTHSRNRKRAGAYERDDYCSTYKYVPSFAIY